MYLQVSAQTEDAVLHSCSAGELPPPNVLPTVPGGSVWGSTTNWQLLISSVCTTYENSIHHCKQEEDGDLVLLYGYYREKTFMSCTEEHLVCVNT